MDRLSFSKADPPGVGAGWLHPLAPLPRLATAGLHQQCWLTQFLQGSLEQVDLGLTGPRDEPEV